jgi:hypothetical protein
MSLYELLVLGLAVPAALALGVGLLAGWLAHLRGWPRLGQVGATLGLGTAYAVSHVLIQGWPPFPALETWQWLLALALGATLLGMAEDLAHPGRWIRCGVRLLLAPLVVWLFVRPLLDAQRDDHLSLAVFAGLTVLVILFLGAIGELAARQQRRALAFVLGLVTAATALALVFSHNLSLGKLAGALAGAQLGALVAAVVSRQAPVRGTATVAAVLLTGLVLDGHYYSDLPTVSALLLALAPLGLALVRFRPVCRMRPWLRRLMVATVVAVPLVVALGIPMTSYMREDAGGQDEQMMRGREPSGILVHLKPAGGSPGYPG